MGTGNFRKTNLGRARRVQGKVIGVPRPYKQCHVADYLLPKQTTVFVSITSLCQFVDQKTTYSIGRSYDSNRSLASFPCIYRLSHPHFLSIIVVRPIELDRDGEYLPPVSTAIDGPSMVLPHLFARRRRRAH